MAKKPDIKVLTYVHAGDKLVETDQLTAEQRELLGQWLKATYLNHLYAGDARFRYREAQTDPGSPG